MQADAHESLEVVLPQRRFATQLLRNSSPGLVENVGIRGLLQRHPVNLRGPLVQPCRWDLCVLAKTRQQLAQRIPVLEPVVQPRHQCERLSMIRGVFFDPAQRGKRLLVLAAVELKLGLGQQDRVRRLGRFLEGHAQPFIPAVVLALQVCGPRCLQVVEQWRVAGAGRATEQPFAARQVAFGDCDQSLGQFLSRACGAITAGGLAEPAGRRDELVEQPQQQHEGDSETRKDGHRHLDELPAEYN